VPIERVFKATIPFLCILLVDLVILTFVPEIILFVPNLIK
jgi:TRAP-type C4-dicarboxylate transport system permease large subunit